MSGTRIEYRDDDYEGGVIYVEDLREARAVTSALQNNGYAVNLRGYTERERSDASS